MQKIPCQDLEAHHHPLEKALQEAALRVLSSGRYILGPEVEAFEGEVTAALGVRHAIGVSSGTDALLALLMAAGVGPGDEVVTTPFSFFATAGAVVRLGARPVFADVEPHTLNLDPDAVLKRLGPRTKAVLLVHLFGRVGPFQALADACQSRGIPLFEDAAQAIGAFHGLSGRKVGTLGAGAALSFFPSKNLGGFGDGGMVITDDQGMADRVRLLRVHGARPKYHHLVVGGNFRLDELQAALLRVKLPQLPGWTDGRRRVAARYRQRLEGTPLGLPPEDRGCVWNQYVVQVPGGQRDPLAQWLRGRGVETAVYYPEPLHLQPCFASLGHRAGDFPVAEGACAKALALPIYPELSLEAVDQVCALLSEFFADSAA